MQINDNGTIREMTPAEIKRAQEMTSVANDVNVIPMDVQGRLDRLEATQLEQDEALMELAAMAGGI